MAKKQEDKQETGIIELKRLQDAWIEVPIIGKTPVILHKWSEKAKKMMDLSKDEKRTISKVKRNPEKEAEECMHRFQDGRPGVPASAFKAAIIGACRFFDGMTLVETKSLIYVEGENAGGDVDLVPIIGTKELRTDPVRIGQGTADLRSRYMFTNWRATLKIRYVEQNISAKSIVALVDAAGRLGVGDWRPSSPKSLNGNFGTWRVDDDQSIREGNI